MSKIAISGASTGSATFTIESPATSTNRTITIPDATTTLVGTDATQTLTNKSIVATQLTGTIAAARLPAGSVLQVLQTTKNNTTSTTSTSYVDISGMSVSITPSSASNKVLVMFSISTSNTTQDQNDIVALVRDSTFIAIGTGATIANCSFLMRENSSASTQTGAMTFLDSPATTSAVTYKLQWAANSGSTLYLNRRGNNAEYIAFSTITVMEIAG